MVATLDHVFICCSVGAPEAAALSGLGIQEGSPNRHPGQGTACRRFFFRNAYVELLWVSEPNEAQGEPARRTRLWERWSRRHAGTCPFGVVLRPGPRAVDSAPPFLTWSYRPQYLPPDLTIEIAVGTPLGEPELFFIGFGRRPDDVYREPLEHAVPLNQITGVRIGIPASGAWSSAAASLEAAGIVLFRSTDEYVMSLEFDGALRGETADLRPQLPLLLRW